MLPLHTSDPFSSSRYPQPELAEDDMDRNRARASVGGLVGLLLPLIAWAGDRPWIVTAERIWTGDAERPWASALVVDANGSSPWASARRSSRRTPTMPT